MDDPELLGRWRNDEQALAAIGAALFAQDTTCRVRIPSALADVAVAAWRRTDLGDPAHDEDDEHRVVRERAAALALLGAQLDGTPSVAGGDIEASLDAWYIGLALGAADDLELIGPDAPARTEAAAPAADDPIGFSLWLEFEHVAEPITDFCNVGVTTSDDRSYGLNVWTFDFVQSLASGATADESGELAAGYTRAPDLLVRELTRAQITAAVTHLLANGGLPASTELGG